MSEPLRITRTAYELARTAWVQKEISQPKFSEMFEPLHSADNPFPPHDPSPVEFLCKYIERKKRIDGARRDYQSEKERLSHLFDDCAGERGVVVVDE